MDAIKKKDLYETSIPCEVDFDIRQLKNIVEHITMKYRQPI